MNIPARLSSIRVGCGVMCLASAAAIVVALFALGVFATWRLAFTAAPRIEVKDGVVTAENYWSEKVLGIRWFELTDLSSGEVVLRGGQSKGEAFSRIRLFEGSYRVEPLELIATPKISAGPRFRGLEAGHKYRLVVWGNNGAGGEAVTTKEFVQ